jgi:hypothetical protein
VFFYLPNFLEIIVIYIWKNPAIFISIKRKESKTKIYIKMENLKRTELGKSYWNNNGIYQNQFDSLTEKLQMPTGSSETLNGELIRAVNRLYYEYCNNGNCNACETKYEEVEHYCDDCSGDGYVDDKRTEECSECCGSGFIEEEEATDSFVSEFYQKILDLIKSNVPDTDQIVSKIETFISQNHYSSPNQFTDERMDLYNELTDRVVYYVLNNEGAFIWDGFNEQSQLAPGGIYLLQADIFDTDGQISKFTKTFVLAVKLK